MLLALDAIELLFEKSCRYFVVASSDGDFSHLAARLREHGATVIGVGEAKAPAACRACCSDFAQISLPPAKQTSIAASGAASDLDQKIRLMIAEHSKHDAGMRIVDLAPKMHRQHNFRISSLQERTWRAYLSARPGLYCLDPRGPEAMVRFKPEGFAQLG